MCCSPTQPAAQAAHQGSHMLVICSIVYCMCNAYTFVVAALAFFGKVKSTAALQCSGRVVGAKHCVRDTVSERAQYSQTVQPLFTTFGGLFGSSTCMHAFGSTCMHAFDFRLLWAQDSRCKLISALVINMASLFCLIFGIFSFVLPGDRPYTHFVATQK